MDPIQLSLDQSASYIQNRREVTVHSAIPSVSYNGVNTLRLLLSDAVSWADPQSMYISFNIVNEDQTNPLGLIGQPHVMFDRVSVRAGGAELEDIALFNRLSEQFDIYQSAELKQNKAIYGFPAQSSGAITAVGPGKQAKVCMTLPLSAVFGTSQTKYLPHLRHERGD